MEFLLKSIIDILLSSLGVLLLGLSFESNKKINKISFAICGVFLLRNAAQIAKWL